MSRYYLPPWRRILLALLAAVLVGAWPTLLLGLGALGGSSSMLLFPLFGVIVALGHVLVLGLPAYLLLARRMRISSATGMIAGMLIGAAPISLLLVASGAGITVLGPSFWFGLLGTMGGGAFVGALGPQCEREA